MCDNLNDFVEDIDFDRVFNEHLAQNGMIGVLIEDIPDELINAANTHATVVLGRERYTEND
jgi:hypothetical protein